MEPRAGGWLVAVAAIALRPGPAAGWNPLDAPSLAQGGLTAVLRMARSPGAGIEAGTRFRFSVEELYLGTELTAASLAVESARRSFATTVSLGQLRSPVHRDTQFDIAAQVRISGLQLGAGATLGALDFASYGWRWQAIPRLGAGGVVAGGLRVAAMFELQPDGSGGRAPGLVVAVDAALAEGLRLGVQQEREAGTASRTRLGLAWDPGVLRLFAGYDLSALSASVGCAWTWSKQSLAWGATSHPELGWSHAWTYEIEP